ncbi:MAG TPA: hypothetical protein VK578_15875 [Edaphobacter sp.]|nr:hypothetical protein [Edaphobacter sp.]
MKEVASRRFEVRSTALYQMFLKNWFPIFAAITVIGLIVPIRPEMPRGGLDPSWVASMNEAVASHMKIGHDVIFTFGPYSALYTRFYHPAIDHLIILSGLILAVSYLGALLYLTESKNKSAAVILLIFLGWFMQSTDALFFSYPLLLSLCAVKFYSGQQTQQRSNFLQRAFAAALCVPLGLLPLVKGNLIVLCIIMIAFIVVYQIYHRDLILAAISIVVPGASLVLFWTIAGQPLNGLSEYASNSIQILSGYTEAMGVQGEFRGILGYLPDAEIAFYLIAAFAVIWSLTNSKVFTPTAKIFLGFCFTLVLFVGFKSGFVRHDGHPVIAANSVLLVSLLAGLRMWDRRVKIAIVLSALLFAGITLRWNTRVKGIAKTLIPNYMKNPDATAKGPSDNTAALKERPQSLSEVVSEATFGVYGHLWNGLRVRLFQKDELANQYRNALMEIRRDFPIAKLTGTLDIYPTEQIDIIASKDIWNPRPIFQSYAAWMPKLALINEQHLRTEKAPDYVLFQVSPEDQHLPSLEDGVSWTAFLDNYMFDSMDQNFVYLRKRKFTQDHPYLKVLQQGVYKTGQSVALQELKQPIFAEIDLEPTLLGKLVGIIFKPTQVRIFLKLSDGTVRDYRVLPNMMKTGFFVSPLVEDAQDFGQFMRGDSLSLSHAVVKEMVITPNHPGWMIWKDHYTLRLAEYRGGAWSQVSLQQ